MVVQVRALGHAHEKGAQIERIRARRFKSPSRSLLGIHLTVPPVHFTGAAWHWFPLGLLGARQQERQSCCDQGERQGAKGKGSGPKPITSEPEMGKPAEPVLSFLHPGAPRPERLGNFSITLCHRDDLLS